MAYGTTLDSLNNAILQEKAQRADEANGFRNYLLGLAGERNRGRQVDVNAMDAGTRREGLGVQERLGNRQWDTEGRRVDVLGRDVDMREKVGMGQIGVQRDDIAARERIASQDADVRRRGLEIDEMYKRALAGDLAAARRLQELGITTSAGLEGRRIDLSRDEMGKRYGVLGDRLSLDREIAGNQFTLGKGQLGVAMTDAETRASDSANRFTLGQGQLRVSESDARTRAAQVALEYDYRIKALQEQGRFREAENEIKLKQLAVSRELGMAGIENDRTRANATKTLAEAQAYGIMNPSPSDALRVNVADRNSAEQAAFDQAGPVAAMLNNKINASDGWFDFQNPEVVNDMLLNPQIAPSLKYLVEDPKTHMWSVNPAARPIMTDLMRRPTQPTPTPSRPAPQPATQQPPPSQVPLVDARPGYRAPATWGEAVYGPRYGSAPSPFPTVDPYMLYGGDVPAGQYSEPEPLPDLVLPPMPPPRSGERWIRDDPSGSSSFVNPGSSAAGYIAQKLGSYMAPATQAKPTQNPQAPGRQIRRIVIRPDGTAAWE